MELTELKQDFYKRFNASDNFLHFTANGIACPLLGCTETEYTPSLSCSLSMGVQMFARGLEGNIINIQQHTSDKCLSYIPGTSAETFRGYTREYVDLIQRLEPYKLRGTQILFEYSVPKCLPRRETLFITLTQSLAKVSKLELEPLQIAALASYGDNINKYIEIIYSKKGYATLVSSGIPKNYPLPLRGYKIVSLHCAQKSRSRAKQIRYAFEHIRRLFPHITSVSEVTHEMLTIAAPSIKSRQAMGYMCHLVDENKRISESVKALQRCDVNELFLQMHLSQASMERYWNLDSEHIFLANRCKSLQGVAAARSCFNGAVAIVEEDAVDYAVNIVMREFETNVGYRPSFCVSDVI